MFKSPFLFQKMRCHIAEGYPLVLEIVFQKYDVLRTPSHENFSFIYQLNENSGTPKIIYWIFTEPSAGRGRHNPQFLYVSVVLKLFVEDGNNVDMQIYIDDALYFRGGDVSLDFSDLANKSITKKDNSSMLGIRSTLATE